MKQTLILILLTLVSKIGYPQNDNKKIDLSLYPNVYTLEKAILFQENKEYEKAIWFYINLYPENKSIVIEKVKQIIKYTDDIAFLIQKSFGLYGLIEPNENGEPTFDLEKSTTKGKWADEIIEQVANNDIKNQTANNCSEFKVGKFKYIGKNENVTIIQDSIYHIETDGIRTLKLRIKWINDCEYKLTYIKVNQKGDEELLDKTMYVKIYETTNNSYKYGCQMGDSFEYGEIRKIE